MPRGTSSGSAAAIEQAAGREQLGELLQTVRRRRGLSQHAVAGRALLSRNTVAQLESACGFGPTLPTVSRLAYALEISVAVLTTAYVSVDGCRGALALLDDDGSSLTPAPKRPGAARVPATMGAVGMGALLAALRCDAQQERVVVVRLSGTDVEFVRELEDGQRRRPGLSAVARVASAIADPRANNPARAQLYLALLARVYAEENTVDDALAIARDQEQGVSDEH